MPFSPETKTRMFVRCGRLCCLCLKQCGTNIEAAHIVGASENGPDDEENGIPLCFDCHAEVGAYNDKHPRGNKFRPQELKARRDRVYRLVESGAIYAQVIAAQVQGMEASSLDAQLDQTRPPSPSAEATRLCEMLLSDDMPDAPSRKMRLLSQTDRAGIIDRLLSQVAENPNAVRAIARIGTPSVLSEADVRIVLEQTVRAVTLFGSVQAKAALLAELEDEDLAKTDEELRLALFDDVIQTIGRDQFDEVNALVPPLVLHNASIPRSLHADYVLALLDQAQSRSYHGAPAARRALDSLPDDMARAALPPVDEEYLRWHGNEKEVRRFIEAYHHLSGAEQAGLHADYVSMTFRAFAEKHFPDEW